MSRGTLNKAAKMERKSYPEPPVWSCGMKNVIINTTVPFGFLPRNDEHSDVNEKALTLATLNEKSPQEPWIECTPMDQPQMQFVHPVSKRTMGTRG